MLITLKYPQCKINLLTVEIHKNRSLDVCFFFPQIFDSTPALIVQSFFFTAEHSLTEKIPDPCGCCWYLSTVLEEKGPGKFPGTERCLQAWVWDKGLSFLLD